MKKILMVTNDSTVFLMEKGKAEEMFGGRVTEFTNLRDALSDVADVDTAFITGRYGLMRGTDIIEEYDEITDTPERYTELQKRTGFAERLSYMSGSYDEMLIFLPKGIMSILIETDMECHVTAVTHPSFREEFERRGWTFMERRGARIGRENAKVIVSSVSST